MPSKDTGDNGVHASASPFEALAERSNWLRASISKDAFGKALLASGIPLPLLTKEWWPGGTETDVATSFVTTSFVALDLEPKYVFAISEGAKNLRFSGFLMFFLPFLKQLPGIPVFSGSVIHLWNSKVGGQRDGPWGNHWPWPWWPCRWKEVFV